MDMSAEDVVWVVILLRIVPQILTLLMTHIKVKEFLNSNYGKETLILPLRNSLKTNIRYLEELSRRAISMKTNYNLRKTILMNLAV